MVVFSDEHIAEVKMLATIMATAVAGELLAAFVVFKNLRRPVLRESKVSKYSAGPRANRLLAMPPRGRHSVEES